MAITTTPILGKGDHVSQTLGPFAVPDDARSFTVRVQRSSEGAPSKWNDLAHTLRCRCFLVADGVSTFAGGFETCGGQFKTRRNTDATETAVRVNLARGAAKTRELFIDLACSVPIDTKIDVDFNTERLKFGERIAASVRSARDVQ